MYEFFLDNIFDAIKTFYYLLLIVDFVESKIDNKK